MADTVDEFNEYRQRMNDRVLDTESLVIKRFFSLDASAYRDGAIDRRSKEMIGLAASMVLRCDDCVRYHIQECHKLGLGRDQIEEVFGVALVAGGSIVIPHLRRAVEFLDALEARQGD